jgi:hypothetical protein
VVDYTWFLGGGLAAIPEKKFPDVEIIQYDDPNNQNPPRLSLVFVS